jgi:deoxyribonuclease-4
MKPPLLGAHMSIAGGLEQALWRGHALGCRTVQLFTKNACQWKERSLGKDEKAAFRKAKKETKIGPVISHGGYLVNLASPDPDLRKKSISATLEEMRRCEALGVEYLVIHPGAYRRGSELDGVKRVISSLNLLGKQTQAFKVEILLEITAGQGTYIGSRLEQLAEIMDGCEDPAGIGLCLDTCHAFSAGYDLSSEERCDDFFGRIDCIIGLERLRLIHLNDSLFECGSGRDRHAHIGRGKIGERAFRRIMQNESLENIPKIIETPKMGDMDQVNLNLLRGFAGIRSLSNPA